MTKIIILAAGKGTRMGQDLPKVLTPLNDTPIIKYLLDTVFETGIDEKPILVVSEENIDLIKDNLKNYNLEYVIQSEQLGTGHAVNCGLNAVSKDTDKVIVLYGDHPFLRKESLLKLNEIETNSVTLTPITVADFESWRYNTYHWGRIIRNDNEDIIKITEFKDASEKEKEIKELNPGIMAFNYFWLKDNISKLNNDNNKHEYYLTDLTSLANLDNKIVNSVIIEAKESIGINTHQELELAKLLLNK
ncbi:MAG: NTP transferase domain-containing protein [Patescibacteria group bacterium]|jgi:bifunctional UDP-N-acetylglucosamine pyrophosphorylase/glucosamine-1-phosphate N-acetyltransferase|nr:NTP transferase domain-containing protein [Patescibacteria group bacterium]